MPTTLKKSASVRTTVSLPEPLYEDAKAIVEGFPDNRTLNSFFVRAIKTYVDFQKRRTIDAAFAHMSADKEYRAEAQSIADEFGSSDWEAFESAESGQL